MEKSRKKVSSQTTDSAQQPNEIRSTNCVSDAFMVNLTSYDSSSDEIEVVLTHSNNSVSDDRMKNCMLDTNSLHTASCETGKFGVRNSDVEILKETICLENPMDNHCKPNKGEKSESSPVRNENSADENADVNSNQRKQNMELKEVVISDPLTEDGDQIAKNSKLQSYRCELDSLSDDSSSSSFGLDSSSDCSDSFLDKMHKNVAPSRAVTVKTKGELGLDDLPPIQELKITISEKELYKCGTIYAIVDKLVVVRALKKLQPLDLDSVLFLSSEQPLGRVFDVFGPVIEPFYSVRFNTTQDIVDADVTVDADVFYAPGKDEITSYVFVDELKQQKGSDASWKDNNEPPEEFLDYSDDEQEKAAKLKRRAKNRPSNRSDDNLPVKKRSAVIPPFRKTPGRPIAKDNFSSRLNSCTPSPFEKSSYNLPRFHASSSCGTSSNSIYPTLAETMTSSYTVAPTLKTQNVFQVPPAIFTPPSTYVASQPQNISIAAQFQRGIVGSPLVFRAPQPILLPQQHPNIIHLPPQQQNMISLPPPQQNGVVFSQQQTMVSSPSASFSYFSQPYVPQQRQNTQSPSIRLQQTFVPPPRASPMMPMNQQPHLFGQITPLGPMSPALQQPNHPFSPTVISAAHPSLLALSFPSGGQPTSYFSSAPSPPLSRQIANSNWQRGRSVAMTPPPNSRILPSMTPLSIQIPNMRSPPPPNNVPAANVNGVPASFYTTQTFTGFTYQR